MSQQSNDVLKIRAAFSRASRSYDAAAVLQREVCDRLSERLEELNINPQKILDLGAGTGNGTRALKKAYSRADIYAVDFAFPMLQQLRSSSGFLRRPIPVCADAQRLPFRSQAFDLAFSSLTLQWCLDLQAVWAELRRVMKPGGTLLFATLGPATLHELRAAWTEADQYQHVNPFLDMHDIGDAMMKAGFKDPVLDIETITLTYREVRGLLSDLKALGANTVLNQQSGKGLLGKRRYAAMQKAYEPFKGADGSYPATFEVVYGLAWQPELTGTADSDVHPLRFMPPESKQP